MNDRLGSETMRTWTRYEASEIHSVHGMIKEIISV